MSTRSRIGVIRSAGDEDHIATVESIYCHHDGYPSYVGQKLLDHWSEPEKLDALIALGDLSVLGSELGEKHDFDQHVGTPNLVTMEWPKDSPHARGWCSAYNRDRGEEDVASVTHPLNKFPDYGQEYEYVFDPDNDSWFVKSPHMNPVGWNTGPHWEGFIPLAEAIRLDTNDE